MEYLTLNTGAKMPIVGLGTWNLSGQECVDTVSKAIDNGYQLIDTAQMYDNEREVGFAIANSKMNRESLFITTKLDSRSNSYQKAKDRINQSLSNLNVDYLDLLLIHEPYSSDVEIYHAMEEALKEGKIKAIGLSNYNKNNYQRILENCKIIPAVNQIESHLFFQRLSFQNFLSTQGTLIQAWSPLSQNKVDLTKISEISSIADHYSKTPAQVVLRFMIQRGISVIPKTRREERLIENISLFDFELSKSEMETLFQLDKDETLFKWTIGLN